ncbi:MAG: NADPH-dependent 7-cyano-7-deazaguanine reductase QueF [Betaproteobacteria bacterium]|nr:NADPH-dependent 7-cyano-7-deazaguanine reductase QueF [Betaproteobacteria bacterium]
MTAADIGAGELPGAPLGQATGYPDHYAPAQLYPVARAPQRAALGIRDRLPFAGVDQWTAYELTWLDPRGRPEVALASFEVPVDSPSIIESKSVKLYLGSLAQTCYPGRDEVATTLARDLSAAAGAPVAVRLEGPQAFAAQVLRELDGESLDELPVACDAYDVDPALLAAGGAIVDETLTTRLFRSVCPVTGQPDIASVQIAYRGPRIDRQSLLRYLVSYRCHAGFHEHCVERIFVDVAARCRCEALTVLARFTRRGGIDINPFRSNAGTPNPSNVRTARQ